MRALVEEQNDGDYDGKGSFKDHSHILEEGENEFQVYIFELDELGFRYSISALFGHSEWFRDEFSGECAFDFNCQLIKQPFRVFWEEDSQELH